MAELAEREFKREFHRNSIRLFALRHGYYHALPEEKSKVYTRFETSGPGALFQHDSSPHLWIPLLGQRQSVILTEDDYSRKVLGAVILEKETAISHLRSLPYICEKKRIKKITEAQAELDELVGFYNDCRVHQETEEIPSKRWDRAVKEGKGKLRLLNDSLDLDWVFSLHYERTVQKDGTVSFYGKRYKIGRYPGQKVMVCLIPNKKIMFYKGMDKICEYHL